MSSLWVRLQFPDALAVYLYHIVALAPTASLFLLPPTTSLSIYFNSQFSILRAI